MVFHHLSRNLNRSMCQLWKIEYLKDKDPRITKPDPDQCWASEFALQNTVNLMASWGWLTKFMNQGTKRTFSFCFSKWSLRSVAQLHFRFGGHLVASEKGEASSHLCLICRSLFGTSSKIRGALYALEWTISRQTWCYHNRASSTASCFVKKSGEMVACVQHEGALSGYPRVAQSPALQSPLLTTKPQIGKHA